MRSFVKIKPSQIGDITLVFTDICKSCPVRDFLTSQMCLNAIRENKTRGNFRMFTVCKMVILNIRGHLNTIINNQCAVYV